MISKFQLNLNSNSNSIRKAASESESLKRKFHVNIHNRPNKNQNNIFNSNNSIVKSIVRTYIQGIRRNQSTKILTKGQRQRQMMLVNKNMNMNMSVNMMVNPRLVFSVSSVLLALSRYFVISSVAAVTETAAFIPSFQHSHRHRHSYSYSYSHSDRNRDGDRLSSSAEAALGVFYQQQQSPLEVSFRTTTNSRSNRISGSRSSRSSSTSIGASIGSDSIGSDSIGSDSIGSGSKPFWSTFSTFGISGSTSPSQQQRQRQRHRQRPYSSSSQLFDSRQKDQDGNTSKTSTSTPTPTNDTIAINTVGKALSIDQQLTSAKSKAASELILAIDPATIEVVPFSDLAKEGEVFGGPSSSSSNNTTSINNIPNTNSNTNAISNMFSETSHKPSLFNFVNMFRGSANYIANHRNTIVVYHIPGDLLSWDGFSDLMDDIALTWLLGIKPVIVIGCRKQIDDRVRAMTGGDFECSISSLSADGSHVECIPLDPVETAEGGNGVSGGDKGESSSGDSEGNTSSSSSNGGGGGVSDNVVRYDSVRITDLDTLRIVKEEAGFVRFEVERQLGRALHLHGIVDHDALSDGNVVSGNFYSAQPYGVIDGVDFMYTGYPRRFEVEKIHQVLKANDVVLLTPLGSSPSGEIFNVNTEHLAACVAGALKAAKVIYFTNTGTAFREKNTNKLVQNLKLSDARNLLKYNNIIINNSKGFATIEHDANLSPDVVEAFVKTGWSIAALDKGVKRAHIIAPINGALLQELYTRDGSGTLISRDIYEGIRNANVNDVAGIYELIEPLVSAGYLVNRPKNVLEKDISSYYVFTRDNLIIACAQLKLFENGYAEIGCMVVKKEYRSQGRGDAMLCFLERLSVMCGCPNVFVLSTQTMEWFVEHGYKAVEVDELPPSRKKVYNYQRRSKIYMKHIENIRDLDAAELWWNR